MSLANLMSIENIILDADCENKTQLFDFIENLVKNQFKYDNGIIAKNLMNREKLGSTGLGYGIAMPHARIKNLKTELPIFIRLKNPIEYESFDNTLVKLVFALLVPENSPEMHLETLSEIAQLVSNKTHRTELSELNDINQILDIIKSNN